MKSSMARLLLEWALMLLCCQVALMSAASIPILDEFTSDLAESVPRRQLPATSSKSIFEREKLQFQLHKQLLILQRAEENIVNHIKALEAERRALSQRKRSHFTSMCMFNVVACYRRRK